MPSYESGTDKKCERKANNLVDGGGEDTFYSALFLDPFFIAVSRLLKPAQLTAIEVDI